MTIVTIARLTLLEASRRKVIWTLAVLTALLVGLDAWGFYRLTDLGLNDQQMTSGEVAAVASVLLNLVLFALSLIVALGTAFLAGPTLAGELETGAVLALCARPVRRAEVIVGKWLGLSLFAMIYVAVAGLVQFGVVQWITGYAAPHPVQAVLLLGFEAVVLLTLALAFSSVLSPLSSGVLSVGLFGAAWVAGIVGGIGGALHNGAVEKVGTISHIVLPTDGLWHAAMGASQAPSLLGQVSGASAVNPFVGAPASPGYLAWCIVWVLLMLALSAVGFARRDL